MRRLSIAAMTAVPFLLATAVGQVSANPPPYNGFGCGDFCLGLFKNIHQHGPLFNYGPYYGYYPFAPYGPWDQYLRYNPFYYGDPYANWVPWDERRPSEDGASGAYGRNPNLPYLRGHGSLRGHGFLHASWLHGGWFHGHTWLHGTFGHKKGCVSCGGAVPAGDVTARYSGFGTPDQSAAFYAGAPALNPVAGAVPADASK